MAKYTCVKGHVHSTQEKAHDCYICKRRSRRRDGRRSSQKEIETQFPKMDGSLYPDGNRCAALAAPTLTQMAEAYQDRTCDASECIRGGAAKVGLNQRHRADSRRAGADQELDLQRNA